MGSLLPCPFCGGEPQLEEINKHYHVYCLDCAATPFSEFTMCKAEAIELWNGRSPEKGVNDCA